MHTFQRAAADRIFSPKLLRIFIMFSGRYEAGIYCSFCSAVILTPKLSHRCHFYPVSLLLFNSEPWPSLVQVKPAVFCFWSGFCFDQLDTWSTINFWCNFGRAASPGKVKNLSMFFSTFENNGSYCGVCVTLSRLIDVKVFNYRLYLKHDVLLFEMFWPISFCQKRSFQGFFFFFFFQVYW